MDRDMPRANSALSSKTEFDQAGPKPSQFVVYGMLGIAEPQAWDVIREADPAITSMVEEIREANGFADPDNNTAADDKLHEFAAEAGSGP